MRYMVVGAHINFFNIFPPDDSLGYEDGELREEIGYIWKGLFNRFDHVPFRLRVRQGF